MCCVHARSCRVDLPVCCARARSSTSRPVRWRSPRSLTPGSIGGTSTSRTQCSLQPPPETRHVTVTETRQRKILGTSLCKVGLIRQRQVPETGKRKALFTPSDPVTSNAMLTSKMGMQPILPIADSVKKIKGAAHQRSVLTLGVNGP